MISTSTGTNMQQDATNEQLAVNASGRKLITDFFILPPNQNKEISKPPVQESSCSDKARASSSIPARKRTVSTHVGSIPEWMCIPGINFRVVCSPWVLLQDISCFYLYYDVSGVVNGVFSLAFIISEEKMVHRILLLY